MYLGYFGDDEDAAGRAYDEALRKNNVAFSLDRRSNSRINFPTEAEQQIHDDRVAAANENVSELCM